MHFIIIIIIGLIQKKKQKNMHIFLDWAQFMNPGTYAECRTKISSQ